MYPQDFDYSNGCPMCRFSPPPPPPGGMGGMQGGRPPSGPPPAYTPSKAQAQHMHAQGPGVSPHAVESGAIRFCLHKFTFIWLDNGRSFWAFPVFVGRRSLSGWRWNGRFWVYFGIDLRRIDSFICF